MNFGNQQHSTPHIHVHYEDSSAVIEIPTGKVLEDSLPPPKQKLVDAWVGLRHEELMADWELTVNGDSVFKIDPLR